MLFSQNWCTHPITHVHTFTSLPLPLSLSLCVCVCVWNYTKYTRLFQTHQFSHHLLYLTQTHFSPLSLSFTRTRIHAHTHTHIQQIRCCCLLTQPALFLTLDIILSTSSLNVANISTNKLITYFIYFNFYFIKICFNPKMAAFCWILNSLIRRSWNNNQAKLWRISALIGQLYFWKTKRGTKKSHWWIGNCSL